MKRLLNVILIVLALLLMGARDLPRPCLGDGQGNPCAINLCLCTALCTCRSLCDTDVSASATPAADCHMHASEDPAATPAHFSLPEPKPPTLLVTGLPGLSFPRIAREIPPTAPGPYPAPSLLPPVPPPRIQA